MSRIIRVFSLILAVANFCLFCFWASLVRTDFITSKELAIQYRTDLLSLEITAMGVIVAVFGIVLVIVGFFGWQFVVERAELRADKTARETATITAKLIVQDLHNKGQLALGGATTIPPNPTPTVQNVPVEDTQAETV